MSGHCECKTKKMNWFPKLPRTWNHSIGVWDMYFTFWGFSDQLLRHIPSYADLPLKWNLVESCLLSPPQSSSGNAFKTVCVRRDRKVYWLQNPGLSLPKYSMDTTGVSKGKLRWRFAGIWSLPFGSARLSLDAAAVTELCGWSQKDCIQLVWKHRIRPADSFFFFTFLL